MTRVRVDKSGTFKLKRFLKRIDDPALQWKFSAGDVQERIGH